MRFFKKKKEELEYLFAKEIPYNGRVIMIWAREKKYISMPESIYIQVGWRVGEYGIYTETAVNNLSTKIEHFLQEAREYINKLNDKPAEIQKAKDILNNISL